MNRSLLIEKPSKLFYSNECIVVEQGDTIVSVPLFEIGALVIDNAQSTITTALLSKLASAGIDVLMCDYKHMPCARLDDLNSNVNGYGRIEEQLSWDKDVKRSAWQQIVANKVHNQISVVENMCGVGIDVPDDFEKNEGVVARIYFSKLFGRNFMRHANDDINAMLNYGYSLLLSRFAKIIANRGYLTQIGLHHCSKTNNYNFVCDVMEPFRPFVDQIVFFHKDESFGRVQKLTLLDVYNQEVDLSGKIFNLSDAMETYFNDICAFLNGKRENIPKVRAV